MVKELIVKLDLSKLAHGEIEPAQIQQISILYEWWVGSLAEEEVPYKIDATKKEKDEVILAEWKDFYPAFGMPGAQLARYVAYACPEEEADDG